MRKYTNGAKWDLMIRSEDGSSYRLSSIKEKTHTNATMIESIEENFLPVFKAVKKEIAKRTRRSRAFAASEKQA